MASFVFFLLSHSGFTGAACYFFFFFFSPNKRKKNKKKIRKKKKKKGKSQKGELESPKVGNWAHRKPKAQGERGRLGSRHPPRS